jgi:hypothetical protein
LILSPKFTLHKLYLEKSIQVKTIFIAVNPANFTPYKTKNHG